MLTNDNLAAVVHNVRLLIAELNQSRSSRLHFRIVHRFRMPGTDCAPPEEILAIFLLYRGHEYQLRLSPALLLLGDYLLRNSRFAQTASQVSLGIQVDSFYSGHARRGQRRNRISRTAIKEYIKRLHRALVIAFREANLRIDPLDVLTVEESVGNQVLYRWKAMVDVVHLDLTAADVQPIR